MSRGTYVSPPAELTCPVITGVVHSQKAHPNLKVCDWKIDNPKAEPLAERSLVRLLGGAGSSSLTVRDSSTAELAIAEHMADHSPADWLLTLSVMKGMLEEAQDEIDRLRAVEPDTRELGGGVNLGTGRAGRG